eukprot:tig00021038_g17550.t1
MELRTLLAAEFSESIKYMEVRLDDQEINSKIMAADSNGDGQLDFEEFKAAAAQMQDAESALDAATAEVDEAELDLAAGAGADADVDAELAELEAAVAELEADAADLALA